MENDAGEPICSKCGAPFHLPPNNVLQLAPRTMLRNQYLIGRALGHGGFGITYLAWDIGLETRLAIKEYMPNGVAGRSAGDTRVLAYSEQSSQEFEWGLERFLEEARVLKKFRDHPGVVSIDTAFRDNGTAYLVMEYLDGVTLEEFLKRRGGRITVETALRVMLPVVDALAAVHAEGILHRDISPDNIYLARNGKVKLIDFGAARNALGQKSRNLSIILKEGYAPEEQYRSSGVQGPWTDVYATAATLYHCITGKIPQAALDRQAEDRLVMPSRMDVPIDPRVEAALMKALSVRAADRFQSMQDFKAALSGIGDMGGATRVIERNDPRIQTLAAPAVSPPPPAAAPPPPRPPSPRWMWPGILGGIAAIAIVGVMLTNRPVQETAKTNPPPAPAPAPVPKPAPDPRPKTYTSSPPAPVPTPVPRPKPAPKDDLPEIAPPPAPPPPRPQEPPSYTALLQQADQMVRRNQYAGAVQALSQAVRLDPSMPQAYDGLAQLQLYMFGQLPAAIQNYQAAISRGGMVTFRVYHDHGTGNFASTCMGFFYVSKTGVRFMAFNSVHAFNATRAQIRELRKNRFFLNPGRQGVDPHAFHVKLDDGRNFNFAPMSRFGEAERDLIINTAGEQ
jgi:serine/threonine protein kinase